MTPKEFCDGYKAPLTEIRVVEGLPQEQVEQSRAALPLTERDVVPSKHKVMLKLLNIRQLLTCNLQLRYSPGGVSKVGGLPTINGCRGAKT